MGEIAELDYERAEAEEYLEACKATYLLMTQRRWWVNIEGEKIEISSMELRYRQNVCRFLEARAAAIAGRYMFGRCFDPFKPNGEMARDAYEDELDRETDLAYEDPVAWLRTLPIYDALTDPLIAR